MASAKAQGANYGAILLRNQLKGQREDLTREGRDRLARATIMHTNLDSLLPPLLSSPELTKNPVDGFSVGLQDDDNIYVWRCLMEGPAGTD